MKTVMLALCVFGAVGCTEVSTSTVDRGTFEQGGQTYRHLTTTVTVERHPVCTGSCLGK